MSEVDFHLPCGCEPKDPVFAAATTISISDTLMSQLSFLSFSTYIEMFPSLRGALSDGNWDGFRLSAIPTPRKVLIKGLWSERKKMQAWHFKGLYVFHGYNRKTKWRRLFNSVHNKQWFKTEIPSQFLAKRVLVYCEQLLL